MATKITKRWADTVADGTNPLFKADGFQPKDGIPITRLSDMFREGQSHIEVLAKLGICKESYYKACTISKKFKDGHNEGLRRSEAWWMTLGRAGAAGKTKIQPATWIFTMKNRFGYSDKRELTTKAGADNLEDTTINPEMTPEDAAKLYTSEILKKS